MQLCGIGGRVVAGRRAGGLECVPLLFGRGMECRLRCLGSACEVRGRPPAALPASRVAYRPGAQGPAGARPVSTHRGGVGPRESLCSTAPGSNHLVCVLPLRRGDPIGLPFVPPTSPAPGPPAWDGRHGLDRFCNEAGRKVPQDSINLSLFCLARGCRRRVRGSQGGDVVGPACTVPA